MYIDIFLVVLLLWAVFNGWRNGFIKELLNTGGVLSGLLLSLGCYALLGKYLAVDGTKVNMVLSIIAFSFPSPWDLWPTVSTTFCAI